MTDMRIVAPRTRLVSGRGIYDAIISETDLLDCRLMWEERRSLHIWDELNVSRPIPEAAAEGVPLEIYNAYRLGRDSACADMCVITRKPNGKYAALLSLRKTTVCYGGGWWIHGGAILSYQNVTAFVSGRTEKECGVAVIPKALLGVCRTCAADYIGSTLQVCYAGEVPYANVKHSFADSGHTDSRLFELSELDGIPEEQQHWYPMWAAARALAIPT